MTKDSIFPETQITRGVYDGVHGEDDWLNIRVIDADDIVEKHVATLTARIAELEAVSIADRELLEQYKNKCISMMEGEDK